MRLPELKALAQEMGIALPEKARKADIAALIREARKAGGGSPKQAKTDKATKATTDAEKAQRETEKQEVAHDVQEGLQRGRNRRRSAAAEMSDDEKKAALEALGDAAERRAENARHEQGESAGDAPEHDGESRNRRNRDRQNNRRERNRDRQNNRRERNRNRNNDREQQTQNHNEPAPEQVEEQEESLLPVAGILDIVGNNAYLRTGGYLPGKSDAYVSSQTIKRYSLRRGDAIVGAVRPVTEGGNRRGQRQHKYNPLVEITAINGLTPEDSGQRPEFNKLTPLYPQEMLRLETTQNALTTRVIDLVAPIGKGQRGLIVSPPKAGKTMIMQQIAMAIAKNNPEVHLMVVLVDERPEEVTDMQRLVKGEVIASTFDRPASDHTIVAELAVERAKRLVELGQDVVILLDSLTRLGRAYNLATPASGRILSGGVDAGALYPPKKFFGAARNIENGGSLTIIASALVETGSKMDEVIFEEFKGTGNMELRLSRQLADRRIFPAVDVNASGTRREEQLFSPEELKIVWHLRRALGTLEVQEASDYLLGRLRKSQANKDFLMSVVRGMQASE
ncbi:MAG: transcription termination factor Rho [Actinomycetaceae bacterium]|nr:transcription termination factor Rho [Actinomycetaceae bacterium]MDY6143361.1 transcription termination factor Rho [Arcanobacterium sp.]